LDTEQVLPFRSRYLSQNRFILPLGNYEFQLDYRYFARMETIVEELGTLGIVNDAKVRNSAHIFDARIIYDLKELTGQNLNLTLNAFNLFNYYYTQMVGNMGPTRQISLMIQGSFK
jgi:outer membrane receptor protein involved in Fe transport